MTQPYETAGARGHDTVATAGARGHDTVAAASARSHDVVAAVGAWSHGPSAPEAVPWSQPPAPGTMLRSRPFFSDLSFNDCFAERSSHRSMTVVSCRSMEVAVRGSISSSSDRSAKGWSRFRCFSANSSCVII
ncbi:hypothetical protein Rs2_35646 [Raphanus sativus]|nr:hypothetical protein Rs2_35646 [Raphanus sativus]